MNSSLIGLGATLEEPAKEGEPLKINGSAMIASAATKEEVIETLKQDVYTTNGIWNWDKVGRPTALF